MVLRFFIWFAGIFAFFVGSVLDTASSSSFTSLLPTKRHDITSLFLADSLKRTSMVSWVQVCLLLDSLTSLISAQRPIIYPPPTNMAPDRGSSQEENYLYMYLTNAMLVGGRVLFISPWSFHWNPFSLTPLPLRSDRTSDSLPGRAAPRAGAPHQPLLPKGPAPTRRRGAAAEPAGAGLRSGAGAGQYLAGGRSSERKD